MDTLAYWQALILGIVQGLTEFLPISSSGHLVLVPRILHWPSPGLAFDTLVHWGTLVAVLAYFHQDYWTLAGDWFSSLFWRRPTTSNSRLAWLLIIATVPAAVMGVVGKKLFEELFSAPTWVAVFLLITAVILTLSERLGKQDKETDQLALWEALLIGIAQGLAIAPGVSRSGATIAVGLLVGLRRPAAARFSFLLSAPIILGAGLGQLVDLHHQSGAGGAPWLNLSLGFLAAAVTGYVCIRFLLAYLQRGRLYPFAVYCALVGAGSLILVGLR